MTALESTPPPFAFRDVLNRLALHQDLSEIEAEGAVSAIMEGALTPIQIAGFLAALRVKGETVSELVGAARALRSRMLALPMEGVPMVDTCGTGGDGSSSINISTLASFLIAGSGVVVAKHGNRAQSSRSGSHDVLEALGLDPSPTPELARRCLAETKLAFLFAPSFHPAVQRATEARRELGIRTLFNLLGPLTNPAGARLHLTGVFRPELCEMLAEVHRRLGSQRAFVVHGARGLDEIAPAGATHVAELHGSIVRSYEITPEDFGLPATDPDGLRGGDPAFNAEIMVQVLNGGGPLAARNATLMAAAVGLVLADAAVSLREGTLRAARALDEGHAARVLERLRAIVPAKRSPNTFT